MAAHEKKKKRMRPERGSPKQRVAEQAIDTERRQRTGVEMSAEKKEAQREEDRQRMQRAREVEQAIKKRARDETSAEKKEAQREKDRQRMQRAREATRKRSTGAEGA